MFLDSPVSVLRPLQTKQNKILKCILGLPWFTRTTIVHNISNVNYILDQMIKIHIKLKSNIENSNNNLIRSIFV